MEKSHDCEKQNFECVRDPKSPPINFTPIFLFIFVKRKTSAIDGSSSNCNLVNVYGVDTFVCFCFSFQAGCWVFNETVRYYD